MLHSTLSKPDLLICFDIIVIYKSITMQMTFKPGMQGPQMHVLQAHVPGFLKLLWFVCPYVCMLPRALITSGMIWCDRLCVIS